MRGFLSSLIEERLSPDPTDVDYTGPVPDGLLMFDQRLLGQAAKKLHGYLLYRFHAKYLQLVVANMERLVRTGAVGPDAMPTPQTDYVRAFDLDALDLEKTVYLIGFYVHILSSHKKLNSRLMAKNDRRRVLCLESFDYYSAVYAGDGVAHGLMTSDTWRFTSGLGDRLSGEFDLVKALSPEDLWWETIVSQSYFNGDYEQLIRMVGEPIGKFYTNAHHWRDDVSGLVDRMDYFIVYVSAITESVLWEIDLLESRGRTEHTTIVYDAAAIENKVMQSSMQEFVKSAYPENVLWPLRGDQAHAIDATALRDRLARRFLLVSPEEFFACIDVQRDRITAARAPVGLGRREQPLEFRFRPAVEADVLGEIHERDQRIAVEIGRLVRQRAITNLPWFFVQVQLRLYTSLMLGNHVETGRGLAAYAAVVGVVRRELATGTWLRDRMRKKWRKRFLGLLDEHFEMAEYISKFLLSYGGSREFGDYRATANETYDDTFTATTQAVEEFFRRSARPR